MNSLFDVILGRPLPLAVIRGLLFGTFALHLLFVLLTIGTVILGMTYRVRGWWGGRSEHLAWGREILRTLVAHKSLAIVLGVGPLLLIQVGFAVPFFTAVNLFAPAWLLIILFLVVSFLALDFAAHNGERHAVLRLVLGLTAAVLLLAVPAIFAAVLVTTEHSEAWVGIIHRGYTLTGGLAYHWLFRYLHVIGAGVVFAAAYHLLASPPEAAAKRLALQQWMVGGVGAQAVLGVGLYLSLPELPGAVASAVLAVGVLAALALLGRIWHPREFQVGRLAPVLLLILLPMLLTRQLIQDRGVLPPNAALEANALRYRAVLGPYVPQALGHYQTALETVYERGGTIYAQSCAFCHGLQANGKGVEAATLTVPPEDIAAVRAHRPYLRARLLQGVRGTGMPYFTIYTRDRVSELMGYLDRNFHVFGRPGPLPVSVPASALAQARQRFASTCAQCHGASGTGETPVARGFTPRPPDLTQYTLTPRRAFEVITAGYPGTAMPTFAGLPAEVRWGLVEHVNGLFKADPGVPQDPHRRSRPVLFPTGFSAVSPTEPPKKSDSP
jgi:mono/diheme cytochrome c family protein